MRIILSPAKSMREQPREHLDLPLFLCQTLNLLDILKGMREDELKRLWKCNDALTALNYRRIQEMSLTENLTPAIYSYDGIAYQNIGPESVTRKELSYLQEHLRILSGFYGILRPMDGVTPYRLEMGSKLQTNQFRDLYDFWGNRLANSLASESDVILNLASREYSRAVSAHLNAKARFVTVRFAEHIGGKTVEKATLCKMARGAMVRWMAENRIKAVDEIVSFNRLGYHFSPWESQADVLTFIKE